MNITVYNDVQALIKETHQDVREELQHVVMELNRKVILGIMELDNSKMFVRIAEGKNVLLYANKEAFDESEEPVVNLLDLQILNKLVEYNEYKAFENADVNTYGVDALYDLFVKLKYLVIASNNLSIRRRTELVDALVDVTMELSSIPVE